jgi:hypothetical protein
MNDKWQKRFQRLRLFGWLALAGLPFVLAACFASEFVRTFCGVAAAMLIIPGFIYVYVIVIWHWKDRYRGKHGDLWGALILIETSGWMKLVYIFRHIVTDIYHTGRYRLESPQPVI